MGAVPTTQGRQWALVKLSSEPLCSQLLRYPLGVGTTPVGSKPGTHGVSLLDALDLGPVHCKCCEFKVHFIWVHLCINISAKFAGKLVLESGNATPKLMPCSTYSTLVNAEEVTGAFTSAPYHT